MGGGEAESPFEKPVSQTGLQPRLPEPSDTRAQPHRDPGAAHSLSSPSGELPLAGWSEQEGGSALPSLGPWSLIPWLSLKAR